MWRPDCYEAEKAKSERIWECIIFEWNMKWMKCQLRKREEKEREKKTWRDVLKLIKELQNYWILRSKKLMKRFIVLITLNYLIKKCGYRLWTILSMVAGRRGWFSPDEYMKWACHLSGKKEHQSPIPTLFINVLGCFCFNSMTFLWKMDWVLQNM